MSILNNSLLLGQEGSNQYRIQRSLRFNSSDSAYLSRTPSSAGNRKTWTWSGWVKRSALGSAQTIFAAVQDGNNGTVLQFTAANEIQFFNYTGGAYTGRRVTTPVYRDTASWYHIVLAWDSANGTVASRIRLYVNGTEVTTFSTTGDPSSSDSIVNSTSAHYIGADVGFNNQYSNQYLANIEFVDGSALTPSSFAETNATTGQWVPKAYTGSYGTNGFKLDFADNSAATAAALGKDTSGNGNNWTPNNFSLATTTQNAYTGASSYLDAALDGIFGNGAMTDAAYTATFVTPIPYNTLTIVYGNMANNQLGNPGTGAVLSVNGSTVSATGTYGVAPYSSNYTKVYTTNTPGTLTSLGMSAGVGGSHQTGIFEVYVNGSLLVKTTPEWNDSLVDTPTSYGTDTGVGGEVRGNYATLNALGGIGTLANGNLDINGAFYRSSTIGVTSGKWYCEFTAGSVVNNSYTGIYGDPNSFGSTYVVWGTGGYYSTAGGTNNFSSGLITQGDVIGMAFDRDNGTLTIYRNGSSLGQFSGLSLGSSPWYLGAHVNASASTAWTANFGQRPFAYPVSGFKALCDTNLPTPVVAKPSTVFDTTLYTGNGSTQNITGLGFSPDFVWIKARSQPYSNTVFDAIRGATNYLYTDTTGAEATNAQFLTAFNSDGFSLGTNAAVNQSSTTYVAWTWDAGSSNSTNNAGSITSTVRANASAGFSIVTFTAPASGVYSFGHGLGVAPHMVIMKDRGSGGTLWCVYHASVTTTNNSALILNSTAGVSTAYTGIWGNGVTSTVVGSTANMGVVPNSTAVAYCFAAVSGYSSFGSYTGNGSADGPFVYTGFRPRFLLFKRTDAGSANGWIMLDAARNAYNVVDNEIYANLSIAEGAFTWVDFLSNGFKFRQSNAAGNGNGATYIYCAWAESPFQYARAR